MLDEKYQPLAYRIRPKNIKDVFGQEHLIGEDKVITKMLKANRLKSMILYGPPGTGKTTMAMAIANTLEYPYEYFNASVDDKKKLQAVAKMVKESNKPIILIVDEIHRLDKPKQDFLLPFLESNEIIIIGATTENPYITVTPAIRSRVSIYQLTALTEENIKDAMIKALDEYLTDYKIKMTDETKSSLDYLAVNANGDLRNALNALEIIVKSSDSGELKLSDTKTIMQQKSIDMDKNGDGHYNTISAFQKSIRGSDVDAALHYAARIIKAGDLDIITRRLMIIAYEDIGLANPVAVNNTILAVWTAKQVGLPEARIPIANAIVELALSPKSNASYTAFDRAMLDLEETGLTPIPNHLKDTHFKGAEKLGHTGYIYPHDYPFDYIKQQYLPDEIKDHRYMEFKNDNELPQRMKDLKHSYDSLKD